MRSLALLPLLALACRGEIDGLPPTDDTDGEERPERPEGPSGTVREVVDGLGGEVRGDGVLLVIPPGALSEPVEITITAETTGPDGYELLSPFFRFEPDGLVFAEPVSVVIELPEDAPPVTQLYWSTPVGGWGRRPDAQVRDGAVFGTVTHFSTGFAAPPGPETVVFTAPPVEAVDVLFVVDDSGSMSEEQAALAERFPAMLEVLGATGLDWHVGVVTTDTEAPERNGRLVEASTGERWFSADAEDPIGLFAELAMVGTAGSANERGLLAAYRAIRLPTAGHREHNAGFRREDAQLVLVVVSDEDDASSPMLRVEEFATWAEEMRARMLAIVGPAPDGCTWDGGNAMPGTAYVQAAELLGGVVSSICDEAWAEDFGTVLAGLHATACQPLPSTPDPDTLEFFVHPSGTVLPADAWGWHRAKNCVFLSTEGLKLVGDADLGVRYLSPAPSSAGSVK